MKSLTIYKRGTKHVVTVPHQAEVTYQFRPGGGLSELTLAMLQEVDFRTAKDYIFHRSLQEDQWFNETVFPVRDPQDVRWGYHVMHSAKYPQMSPFVDVAAVRTSFMCLELFRQGSVWMLGRMYPGENYIPPQPWQRSASKITGGKPAAKRYWADHAYSFLKKRVTEDVDFHQLSEHPADWYANQMVTV